jgi:hypothetical protein
MVSGKLISFILQAILVVLAVLAFSFIDPFNIFNSKKLNMKDTPTIVSSIQSIGKLITAEYYGEVIQSTGNALEIEEGLEKDAERMRLKNIHNAVREAAADLKDSLENLNNKRKVYRAFRKLHPEIMSDPDYAVLLTLVKKWCNMNEREFLEYCYEDHNHATLDNKLVRPLPPAIKKFDDAIDDYLSVKHKPTNAEERRIANNSLVLLGRGWVKVGFDFSHFDEEHFDYLPDRNLVRLKYHQPEIISATINPWFIPQRKIKGFEYLYIGKTIGKNPDKDDNIAIIQSLKAACLDNLINDAKDAGIMEESIAQAEASLSELFSLLLGKDITVKIYADPLQAFLSDVFSDKKISVREIQSADSVVRRYCEEMPTQTHNFIKAINDSLNSWKINHLSPWSGAAENWEIVSLYRLVARDGFCTSTELDSIERYRAANTALTVKDYLYYGTQHRDVDSLLARVSNGPRKIPEEIAVSVSNSKKKNLDSLRARVQKLRRYLTPTEIISNDETVANLLNQNDVRGACAYVAEVLTYMDEPEPWDEIRYDWRMLAVYRQLQDTANTTKARGDSLLITIPNTPTHNEYFYYLYHTGSFKDLESGKSLWLKVKQANTLSASEGKMRTKVISIHEKNLTELRARWKLRK